MGGRRGYSAEVVRDRELRLADDLHFRVRFPINVNAGG